MSKPLPRTLAISAGPGAALEKHLEAWLESLAAAGVDAVQLRAKELDDRLLFELARRAVLHLAGRCRLVVNGRADVALAAGADGVHLPASGLPAAPLRRRCPPQFLIGRSAHRREEVERALAEGCDYAVFGPVAPTPGKGGAGIPGFEGLREASRAGLPLLALGGIESPAEVERAAAAGAAGIAAIRGFAEPAGAQALVAAASRAFSRGAP